MNRAERRKQAKLTGSPIVRDPIISMKKSDISRIKQEATQKATDIAISLLLSIPIKVMYEKYGWGTKKRLPELAEALTDEYQRFADGEMTLEEYREMVFEYCGVKFKSEQED